jgi:hypothetical protein
MSLFITTHINIVGSLINHTGADSSRKRKASTTSSGTIAEEEEGGAHSDPNRSLSTQDIESRRTRSTSVDCLSAPKQPKGRSKATRGRGKTVHSVVIEAPKTRGAGRGAGRGRGARRT